LGSISFSFMIFISSKKKEMKIQIKGKEIELRKTMRSYILFESITDKAFAPKNITDTVTYFYCVVLASDKALEIEFNDFIDWIDDNEGVMEEFSKWLYGVNKIEESLSKKKLTKTKDRKSPSKN
jgi:hypothetical protein